MEGFGFGYFGLFLFLYIHPSLVFRVQEWALLNGMRYLMSSKVLKIRIHVGRVGSSKRHVIIQINITIHENSNKARLNQMGPALCNYVLLLTYSFAYLCVLEYCFWKKPFFNEQG